MVLRPYLHEIKTEKQNLNRKKEFEKCLSAATAKRKQAEKRRENILVYMSETADCVAQERLHIAVYCVRLVSFAFHFFCSSASASCVRSSFYFTKCKVL